LRSVRPVEVFRDGKGKAVAAGHYSMLVRVVLQSDERTLMEEELTAWSERVVERLKGLGGVQRA
jgi:phenylalanyl-tRNA synthetase beta chain